MGCGSSKYVDPDAILTSNFGQYATEPPAGEKGAVLLPGVVHGGSMTVRASVTLEDMWYNRRLQPGEAIKLKVVSHVVGAVVNPVEAEASVAGPGVAAVSPVAVVSPIEPVVGSVVGAAASGTIATLEDVSSFAASGGKLNGALLKAADGSAAAFLDYPATRLASHKYADGSGGAIHTHEYDACAIGTIYCARPRNEGQAAAKTINGTPMFEWAQIKAPMDILARCDPTSNTFDVNAHLDTTVTLGVYPAAAGGGFEDAPSMIIWKEAMGPTKPVKVKTADQTQGLGVVLNKKAIADMWPHHEVTVAPGVDPILLALVTYDKNMRYKYAMGSGMGMGGPIAG